MLVVQVVVLADPGKIELSCVALVAVDVGAWW